MNYIKKCATFVSYYDNQPSPGRSIAHCVVPPCMGGTRTRKNTVFLNARECLHACGMLWKIAPSNRLRRKYALCLLARLHTPEFQALGGRTAWLLRAIQPYVRGDANANTSLISATLWHFDGRMVSGSQPVLAVETGLDPRRIRDLVCGRRNYANGWAVTKDLAAGGRRKPGRPKVEKPFFDSWQSA